MSKRNGFPTIPLRNVPVTADSNHAPRPLVMVVDDESSIADTLAAILSRSGYSAVTAYDADTALEAALLAPPELLITDVVLPGMNGIDLAIRMKRIFPDCKIILFSGQASTAETVDAAHREGHRFTLLSKPLHPADLLMRIADALKHRAAEPAPSL